MLSLLFGSKDPSENQQQQEKQERQRFSVNFSAENFIPGLVIGFIFGVFLDLSKPAQFRNKKGFNFSLGRKNQQQRKLLGSSTQRTTTTTTTTTTPTDEEFKMVLVVRQDLKMGPGKIASQCAHAATGMYAELVQSQRYLLRQWEQCGQAKIVVTCKNQNDMNKLKGSAESIGLPTFIVADAGRTQVLAGSKTVLAIGPGIKSQIDAVTGKLRLL